MPQPATTGVIRQGSPEGCGAELLPEQLCRSARKGLLRGPRDDVAATVQPLQRHSGGPLPLMDGERARGMPVPTEPYVGRAIRCHPFVSARRRGCMVHETIYGILRHMPAATLIFRTRNAYAGGIIEIVIW